MGQHRYTAGRTVHNEVKDKMMQVNAELRDKEFFEKGILNSVWATNGEDGGYENIDEAKEDWRVYYNMFKVVPDLYEVNKEKDILTVYEIENSFHLTPDKLFKYGQLWFYLDCDWVELRLFIVDRFGHQNEISLCDVFYATLMKEAERRKKEKEEKEEKEKKEKENEKHSAEVHGQVEGTGVPAKG